MISSRQESDFNDEVVHPNILNNMLQDAIEWIKKNLDPEDVFSTTDLEKWAESEGYSKQ